MANSGTFFLVHLNEAWIFKHWKSVYMHVFVSKGRRKYKSRKFIRRIKMRGQNWPIANGNSLQLQVNKITLLNMLYLLPCWDNRKL